MFLSLKRGVVSAILALILEFYAFNFVTRNADIIATRTLPRQILDYTFNFVVFFVVFYLVLTLAVYLMKKIFPKSK